MTSLINIVLYRSLVFSNFLILSRLANKKNKGEKLRNYSQAPSVIVHIMLYQ